MPITKKVVRVSHKLRLCENCGVEERDMAACKHCAKVRGGICHSHYLTPSQPRSRCHETLLVTGVSHPLYYIIVGVLLFCFL